MSSQEQPKQESSESRLGSELRQACRSGDYETACTLLETAAGTQKNILNQKDDTSGNTALHMSCANGHVALVQLLLTHGVQVNSVNESASTPLHYACLTGQQDVVSVLLQNGADPVAENCFHKTPLDDAARAPHQNVIDLLIRFVEDGQSSKLSE